jgi:signal transduction histidine kinase
LEFRVRRKDGQVLTGLGSAELIEVNGEPCVLSVAADISERKMAENALAGVSRKLIEAQEAERTRIARELHDDINQRLAMLAINLKTVREDLSFSETETSRRLEEACTQVSGLENDIQALSHRLHSSGLEYLGLEAAVSGFCREVSERQNLSIHVRFDGVPQTLPHEVSLCLFRVLQEAVHNAVKYSGVRDFEVSLTGGENEIELSVHDSGIGFDPATARHKHGLGLTSMRERLRLVNGQLSIESKQQNGTTILARVPLNASVPLEPVITTPRSVA